MARSSTSWVRALRNLAAVAGVFAAASCSGSGCSGCSGVTPLPGGFTPAKRIENAASVRLTKSGLDFLSQNIGAVASNLVGGGQGTLEFTIPTSNGSYDVPPFGFPSISYTICDGGPQDMGTPKKCEVEINLAGAKLTVQSAAPHDLHVTGTIPVRLEDLPVKAAGIGADVSLDGDGSCPGGSFANIGLDIDISVETDTDMTHARYGNAMLKIQSMTVNKTDLENSVHFCGGVAGAILNFFSSTVVDAAYSGVTGQLSSAIEDQLCQKSDPTVMPSCPGGSNDVSGICRYGTTASAACVSQLLGTDGHADLGGLLAKLSPGTKGGMDFLLAGGGQDKRDDNSGYTWGDLNPVGNGATLGAFGGVEPNPMSGCIPLADLTLPTGIPIPAELTDDSLVTNWPAGMAGPHVGLAISERFTNYALAGMYNSGLLCIGITTATNQLLNSGTFSLLASSLKDLGIQHETQPIGIVIRPTTPPKVTFGNGTNIMTDPNVLLELDQANFDFYMFSSDRFIRIMTATFDIKAPLNLTITPAGITPVLMSLDVENGMVSNSSLLKEDPAMIASALQGLIGAEAGQLLGGGLPAIDVNSSIAKFGLKLDIPPTVDGQGSPGLRKLTKGTDNYLGIFGSFEPAMFQAETIDATGQFVSKDVDVAGLRMGTITKDNAPKVRILAGSSLDDGLHSVEYQVRVDGGLWKPWTDQRYIEVSDDSFRLEGHHVIDVRGRLKNETYTLSEPASVPVIIDTRAPDIGPVTMMADGKAKLDVFDIVSRDATEVRYAIDDGAFTDWQPVANARIIDVGNGSDISIEARDEEGNVGKAQQPLLRGLDRSAASSCGCSLPGRSDPQPLGLVLLGATLAGIAARLRRRHARSRTTKPACATEGTTDDAAPGASSRREQIIAERKRHLLIAVGTATLIGGAFSGCHCGDQIHDGNGYTCNAPDCVTLSPGLIGSYTSTAVGPGDKLWVAGYLEADYDNGYQYGDLVVGTYNTSTQKVDWTIVDGLPNEMVDGTKFNIKGFRGGQTDPGDDVGIWTSVAVDGNGSPAVAYYDRTHHALKYAEYTGVAWEASTVESVMNGDVGKYAKLHLDDNDNPVITYLAVEPATTGFVTSKVRIASGDGKGTWAFSDAVVNDKTPCRGEWCTGGSACVESTGQCEAPGTSCMTCASGTQCVNDGMADSCQTVLATGFLEPYPDVTGLYISTALLPGGGFGIAYYDRVAGTENIATSDATGNWTPTIVDGGDPKNPSDVGIGTSLFVDPQGDWHLSYVDGYNETLKYAHISSGKVVGTEVVDDGLHVGGTAFPDGQHLVGDDSFITVAGDGTIHVSYQDATGGTLHYAVGTANAMAHTWTTQVVNQPNQFAGFFSSQVQMGGQLMLVNWWRIGGITTAGDVSVLAPSSQ